MSKKILKRLPQCFFGLFLCGIGLAFTIEAKLGLNPWDVFHDGFSQLINVRTVSYTHLRAHETP